MPREHEERQGQKGDESEEMRITISQFDSVEARIWPIEERIRR